MEGKNCFCKSFFGDNDDDDDDDDDDMMVMVMLKFLGKKFFMGKI